MNRRSFFRSVAGAGAAAVAAPSVLSTTAHANGLTGSTVVVDSAETFRLRMNSQLRSDNTVAFKSINMDDWWACVREDSDDSDYLESDEDIFIGMDYQRSDGVWHIGVTGDCIYDGEKVLYRSFTTSDTAYDFINLLDGIYRLRWFMYDTDQDNDLVDRVRGNCVPTMMVTPESTHHGIGHMLDKIAYHTLQHDGDPVLAQHVSNFAASGDPLPSIGGFMALSRAQVGMLVEYGQIVARV